MPLPDHPITVNGGCNCGAIRYRADIPALAERPIHPSHAGMNISDPCRLPMIVIDHCNDCRRATGAVLPLWLCTPIAFVTSSFVLRPSLHSSQTQKSTIEEIQVPKKLTEQEERTPWLPASDTFSRNSKYHTYLSMYESSPLRTRFFCSRCGINLAYAVVPMPEGWVDMLDLVLGSVDREDLETEALAPERHLWWDCGIPWVQEMSKGYRDLVKHPIFKVNEVVKEDD